jgi:hypothetical protein
MQQQQQYMPFGWPTLGYLPLPPIIEDNDLFINSVVNGSAVPGPPGEPGVSVVSAEVSPNPGNLLITLSDGTVLDAGSVIGPEGPQGADGPPGPPGPSGGTTRNTTTIVQDYEATPKDYYIGADLRDAATVKLSNKVPNGTEYVIKLEYGAPVGTRKLTVEPEAPALINGVASLTLNTPYQAISIIFNNNNWWTT